MVFSNQKQYYEAIAASNDKAKSTPFIEFMLGEIFKTLKEHQGVPLNKDKEQKEYVNEEFEVNSAKSSE
jgi:2-keto-3-deoxy-galactonokinase